MAKILDCQIQVAESKVPFKVFVEPRSSWRISVSKNGAILRLPKHFSNNEVEKKIDWSRNWVTQQFKKKPSLSHSFSTKNFVTGDTLRIAGIVYTIKIAPSISPTNLSAKLIGNEIHMTFPNVRESTLAEAVPKLLSKLAAKIARAYIHKRVGEINNHYFKKNIASIKFKYNTSNWGSCSTKSNINLSTRLLLAPIEVIDYVIVHELCHLVHMNHSDKFWKLVGSIMPDYNACEKWLKVNSHLCDFRPH